MRPDTQGTATWKPAWVELFAPAESIPAQPLSIIHNMEPASSKPPLLSLALLLSASCVAVSPPPIVTGHALAIPDEEGATTLTVTLATAALLEKPGIDIRVHQQVRPDLKVGASLGGGWNFRSGDWIRGFFSTRIMGVYQPKAENYVGIPFGMGLGAASNGLVYTTLDSGVMLNTADDYGGYLYPVFALSIPLRKGAPHRQRRFGWPGGGADSPRRARREPIAELALEDLPESAILTTYARTTFWVGGLAGVQAIYGEWTSSFEAGLLLPNHGLSGIGILSIAQSRTSD